MSAKAGEVRQAVILAAGFGTRLRPLTDSVPKAMVSVAGKPLLEHHVEWLRRHGVTEIFVNLHHLPGVIPAHFGDGSDRGVRMEYFVEPEIRGTAGGMKSFEAALREEFFVIYGDVFSRLDYRAMAGAFHRRPDAAGMELIGATDHPHDSDLVEVGEDLRFLKIHKKPHRSLPASYRSMKGVFLFRREILAEIPAESYYEIDHQLLPKLLEMGRPLYGHLSEEYTRDIGTLERLRDVEVHLKAIEG
jgi:mannose-1-phosphate guanylyltransferase / phosphomannomutase